MINEFLYMKKKGNCWRMDMNTYLRFIKHVRLFFRERVEQLEEAPLKLAYIDIPIRDFDLLCFLFGGYARNNELVLMEFYPKEVPLPWRKSFTLKLYTEDNILISVFMDAK